MTEKPMDLHKSMNVVKWMFGLFTVVMVVLCGGLFIDGRNRDEAIEQVEAALVQFEADRIDRSVNACADRNDIRIGINRGFLAAAGHDPLTGEPSELFLAATPEQQDRASVFLRLLLRLQVCTTEAIDLWVASNRTEGLVPIDGSDGYGEAVAA